MSFEPLDPSSDSAADWVPRSIGLRLLGLIGAISVWCAVLASVMDAAWFGEWSDEKWKWPGWYAVAWVGLMVVWIAVYLQRHHDGRAGRTSRDRFLLMVRLSSIAGAVIVAWLAAREFAL